MALWTDVIDPATLTGYARASLEEYEQRRGTLARWLPNRQVADIVVRFVAGQAGLVDEARYRAYDAEIELAKGEPKKRTVLELPPVGQDIPVTEYEQLRNRNAPEDAVEKSILATTRRVVAAVADRVERLRGIVIGTGVATIPEIGAADSFGRSVSHDVTAGTLWAASNVDRLAYLETLRQQYITTNGEEPGVILLSSKVFTALAAGDQFRTQLVNGASRPATEADVRGIVEGAGLPPIVKYDRRTKSGKVLDDTKLFLLPAPVETDAWEDTELGATFWGQTLTSTDERYDIEESEQPGIVAGVYRGEKPPLIAEVIADAIAMPVLANADLSLAAKVLA
ncbi:major capsid protein [Microbacterium sp. QXD-8]|uniref:Major capsid protein n=1 Tax=Microbacterium psychrotolerans TaxID=3068321 RepID=A0ABU0YZZ8_9MICO|nr:major capsid protein [Microbacterium sp. QXD-8]MDQ7877365.1 major capsid protein [Microbacterium sp. QXD-8]